MILGRKLSQVGASQAGKISLKEKISYGFGDLASNLLFALTGSYLMYFYTDVAGIGLAAVGTIMLLARVVDAVTDPMMGAIIDKTKSKHGKGRPYLLWMAIPFGLIGALTFFSPDISQQGKVIYAGITYVAFCVIYTAINIPYTSMMSSMTDNEGERLSFNMFKSLGASIGSFIVSGCTLALVAFLGQGNQSKGFTSTVALFGFIGALLFIICFKNTKERVVSRQESVSIKETLKSAKSNTPWMILCLIAFLMFTGMMIKNQTIMYYSQYYLNNAAIAPVLLSIGSFLSIPVALIIPTLAKKIGKRNCIVLGNILVIIGTFAIFLSGVHIPLIFISSVVAGIGQGIALGIIFVMGAEVVDYGEWKTGVRSQGVLTALIGFMVKMGMAVSAALSSFVLAQGGYVPNVVQSESAIGAINFNFIWLPIIISVVLIVISQFYKLDKIYDNVMIELKAKRELAK
ncbi:MAG: MFS transporter [Turicibacter sp.]